MKLFKANTPEGVPVVINLDNIEHYQRSEIVNGKTTSGTKIYFISGLCIIITEDILTIDKLLNLFFIR